MDDLDPVDLEEKQRLRLLTAFHNILTYDDREKVIRSSGQAVVNQARFAVSAIRRPSLTHAADAAIHWLSVLP